MTNLLSQPNIYQLCRTVGFTHMNARIGSAIALCESFALKDGQPHADFDAIGDQELANATWGYSYGGFQIRSLKAQEGTAKIRDGSRLLDPEFNAHSARAIKLNSGWKAWTTYTNGAYKAYLQDLFPPPPNTYVVIGGDTLSKIGSKLGIPWQDIARVNNLHSPYLITIGQKLILP